MSDPEVDDQPFESGQPPLATDAIIQDYVDCPTLGYAVGNGQIDAITTASSQATEAEPEPQPAS